MSRSLALVSNHDLPAPSIVPVAPGCARLVHVENPLMPQLGKREIEVAAGISLSEALDQARWNIPPSTVLSRNVQCAVPMDGALLVRRADWDTDLLRDGEIIILITMPQGGKGGGSQVLGIIAMVALAIAAPYLAGALVGALGLPTIAFGTVTWASIATVGIMLAGSLVVSAIMPGPKPFASSGSNSNLPAASPTYSLSAQQNSARLLEAIPELLGSHMIYCDLIAQPYVDYADNQQRVYQLFAIGIGEYEIEKVRVLNTVVWADGDYTDTYPEMELEFIAPGDDVTLFPTNVATSAEVNQIELLGTNEAGADWTAWFAACAPGARTAQIAIDVGMPGLFSLTEAGAMAFATVSFDVEAQEINDAGSTIGSAFTLLSESITLSTRDTVRRTYPVSVPLGRYQVRAIRTNTKSESASVSDTLSWLALRAFLPGGTTYTDMTVMAVKATASNNLNGQSAQKMNVIATRKLPSYDVNTETWGSAAATRSIAAAASYLCRSANNGGLADSQIDLERLWGLHETWEARGDNFDGVFDQTKGFWDNLQAIVQVGRTKAVLAGGQITFVRDEPKTAYRAAFHPRNFRPGSFSIDYIHRETASVGALLMQFIDRRTWRQNEILCALPGSTATRDTAPVQQLFGITDREHIWREGVYMVAADRYRRRFPNGRTDLDGQVCLFGDKVKVSHWLADWGFTAEAMELEERVDGGDILTLSQPWSQPAGSEGDTRLAQITAPDGRVYGPVTFNLIDDGDARVSRIRLTSTVDTLIGKYAGTEPRDWPVWSGEGLQMERPVILLGTATLKPQDALVVAMKPERGDTAQLVLVLEDERVHEADNDPETDMPEEEDPPVEGEGAGGEEGTGSPNDPTSENGLLITGISAVQTFVYPEGEDPVFTGWNVSIIGAAGAIDFDARFDGGGVITHHLERTFQTGAQADGHTIGARARGTSGTGAWVNVSLDAP